MDNFSKEYTLLWIIENYSYCWHRNKELLISPEFTADDLDGTVWTIELYPKGYDDESKDFISLFLSRSEDDDGPEKINLKFELSVLTTNGSIHNSEKYDYTFEKGNGHGTYSFLKVNDVFKRQLVDYLTQDSLTVRCKISIGEGNIQRVTEFKARTSIEIEEMSFFLEIENFSGLTTFQKKHIQGTSASKKGVAFTSSLYFTDCSCCEEKIVIEIAQSDKNQILSTCNISLLEASGKVIPCGEVDNRFDDKGKGVQRLPLTLTRNAILERKSEYLPNDKLSVLCECVFSSGVEYKNIERTLYELPTVVVNQLNDKDRNTDVYNVAEKLTACSSALDDFQEIYTNQILTDVEVKTKTKNFKAHKTILSARSPVFKSMMTNDMKEKNTDCIQIDDLENDTVHQLLLFLYSDQLENLEWESAIKLYYAADKYEIEKLKVLCSAFLVDNLSISKASELLLLTDIHSDSDLKTVVEDFILENHEQVFGSDEWETLLEKNPLLVSKTMRLKYTRKI